MNNGNGEEVQTIKVEVNLEEVKAFGQALATVWENGSVKNPNYGAALISFQSKLQLAFMAQTELKPEEVNEAAAVAS